MKRAPFKPGDKVYATRNSVWGLEPMTVKTVSPDCIICKGGISARSTGGFHPLHLELVTPERAARIAAYLKAAVFSEGALKKLFGP